MCKRCITLAIAFCVLFGGIGIAQAQNWYAESTSLYWKRNSNRRQFDYFSNPATQLDAANDLKFDFEWGNRYVIGYDNYNWSIEGAITRVDNWNDYLRRTSPVDLHFHPNGGANAANLLTFWNAISQAAAAEQGPPGGAIQSNERIIEGFRYEATYNSSWDDAELNVGMVLPNTTWLKVSVGARYGILDEFFNLGIIDGAFEDDINGPDGAGELTHGALVDATGGHGFINDGIVGGGLTLIAGAPDGFIDNDILGGPMRERSILDIDWDADVENHLVGAQMILDAMFYEDDYWTIEARLKWGAFLNHVTAVLTETYYEENTLPAEGATNQSVYQRVHRDEKDTASFLGNVRLVGGFKLRENIRVKAGYELQLMAGMALAADQWQHVQGDNFGRPRFEIDASESIFVHGGDLTLEVIW